MNLLRLASILARPESRVLIFPEFPSTRSYKGVVEHLLARVPDRHSR